MKYKQFGSTTLQVSEIGFGCARLGGFLQNTTKNDLLTTLHSALDQGITFYDTADMYCQGESEQLLGEAFRRNRDKVVIASKGGYCLPAQRKLAAAIKPVLKSVAAALGIKRTRLPASMTGTISQNFSSDYLHLAVEGSLKRLGTDYLDLYQLHSPPREVLERGEFIETMEQLKAAGKIRFYGVSCERYEDALVCLRYPGISSLQISVGALDQEPLERGVPEAATRGVAIVGRGCLGGGLLNGIGNLAVLKETTPKWETIVGLQRIAERSNRALLELALQFALGFGSVSVTLVGMRTERHLTDNLKYAAAPSLTEAERSAVSALAEQSSAPSA